MASFQIPQFLDSGDKILGPMNLRRFSYFIGGLGICYFVFIAAATYLPGIGRFAIIPVAPFFALTLFIALGKYNGRDAEIYVLRGVIYLLKPRQMIYFRIPDYQDLELKLAGLNYKAVAAKLLEGENAADKTELGRYLAFQKANAERAKEIHSIGIGLDQSFANAFAETTKKSIEIQAKNVLIQRTKQKSK